MTRTEYNALPLTCCVIGLRSLPHGTSQRRAPPGADMKEKPPMTAHDVLIALGIMVVVNAINIILILKGGSR